jgi:hypothetical protein
MTVRYPLRVFLDLSTAHLKPTTPHWLAEQTSRYEDLRQSVYVAATPHGWLVYAEHGIGTADAEIEEWSEEHGVPEDLARCMVKAIELGAEYILFDSEAKASNLLPVYEEEEAV